MIPILKVFKVCAADDCRHTESRCALCIPNILKRIQPDPSQYTDEERIWISLNGEHLNE